VGVTSVLSAVFSFLGFAVLFYYDPFLAAVAAVLILLVLGLLVSGSLRQLRLQREVTHRQGKISGLLFQLLTGVATSCAGQERKAAPSACGPENSRHSGVSPFRPATSRTS